VRDARGGRWRGALLVVGAVLASTLAPPASSAGPWRPLVQNATCNVRGSVDSPAEGAMVPAGPVPISGWAADLASAEGTGVSAARVAVDLPPDYGGTLLAVSYGLDRPEVAELLGDARFAASGFAATWDATDAAPGAHVLYVQVLGPCGWTGTTRTVTVADTNGGAARITAAQVAPTPSPVAVTPSPVAAPLPSATPPAAVAPSPSPTPPLPPPTNLTVAVNPFDGAVSLSWQVPPNLPTIRSFLIVANETDGTQRPLLEVPGSQTRAVLRGLNPLIGYSFSVLAIDSLGQRGAPSAPVTSAGAPTTTPPPTPTVPPWCTPAPLPGAPPYCPGAFPPGLPPGGGPAGYPGPGYPPYGSLPGGYLPGGPLQLTATQTSPSTVQLSWTVLAGASSYNVLQGLNGGPPTLLAAVGSTTSYVATLPLGSSVVFQVQALGPVGQEIGRSNLSPTFSYSAGAVGGQVSAAYSRLVPLSSNQVSLTQFPNGVQVQVQARDANNLAVPNAQVLVQVTGTAVVQGATQLLTDSAGNAVVTLRGTGPGQATLTATVNGLALPGLTYTFAP
jgi:hypothetical protein